MAKHDDGIMALVYAMAAPCVRAAKELDAALAEAAGMGMDPEKLHREAEILARSTTMSTVEAVDHVARRYLDCEVYAAAAADVLGVRNLYLQNRVEENAQEVKKRAEPKPDTRPQEENWIKDNDNWI